MITSLSLARLLARSLSIKNVMIICDREREGERATEGMREGGREGGREGERERDRMLIGERRNQCMAVAENIRSTEPGGKQLR